MQPSQILVADDDPTSRAAVAAILRDEGYDVVLARDGREAVDLFFELRPALVLTDLQMPRLTGIDVLERVRADAPDTPVVIFTAHSSEDAARQARLLGAQGYLNKPIEVDDLLGWVRSLLKNEAK